MSREDGGPAFPVQNHKYEDFSEGMTLRDYFAAKAMQGEMAQAGVNYSAKERALWAYEVADAMLAARKENDR